MPSPEAAYADSVLERIFGQRDFRRMWPPVQTALRFIGAGRLGENRELIAACKDWDWLWAADSVWHPNLTEDEIDHAKELFTEAASLEGRHFRTGAGVQGRQERGSAGT